MLNGVNWNLGVSELFADNKMHLIPQSFIEGLNNFEIFLQFCFIQCNHDYCVL